MVSLNLSFHSDFFCYCLDAKMMALKGERLSYDDPKTVVLILETLVEEKNGFSELCTSDLFSSISYHFPQKKTTRN